MSIDIFICKFRPPSHLVICSWLWQDVVSFADIAFVSLFVADFSCGSCSVIRTPCSGCRDLTGSPSITHCAHDVARPSISRLVLSAVVRSACPVVQSCPGSSPGPQGATLRPAPAGLTNAHPALADLLSHISAQCCSLWRAGPVAGHNLAELPDSRAKSERSAGDGTVQPAGFWYSKRLPQWSSAHLHAAGILSCQPPCSDRYALCLLHTMLRPPQHGGLGPPLCGLPEGMPARQPWPNSSLREDS